VFAGLIGLVEGLAGDECRLWVEMLGKADLICVNVEDLEYATDWGFSQREGTSRCYAP
jgi:hypothetical protein